MKTKKTSYIRDIENSFKLSLSDAKKMIKRFHSEMSKGLSGRKSSLAMIPTFACTPKGSEAGRFIALDLGGTNFRVLEVLLNGKGRMKVASESKYKLQEKDITGTGTHLFNFIAECIKQFMRKNKIHDKENLGFTFSFPIKQTGIASGILPFWNKGFSAKGVVGKDVVLLLNKALKRKGINNVKITALVNDTVGTFAARAYTDRKCSLGIILGTGTNACYPEKISNIKKYYGREFARDHMIINTEWGNFSKIPYANYDKKLDRNSLNPGRQRMEKMVSGMYLGEIARFVFLDMIKNKLLFKSTESCFLKEPGNFKSEHMSVIESDKSSSLFAVNEILIRLGISNSTYNDRKLIKRICGKILMRSAILSTAALSAVVLWIDPKLEGSHTVAVDGSLFEKCSNYSTYMDSAMRKIFKDKAKKLNLSLTKDGSGIGAAIVAATA
jgi:hexokinase